MDTLSTSLQKLLSSPYIKDTLSSVIGGLPPIRQHNKPSGIPKDVASQWMPGDTVNIYTPKTSNYALAHELGHSADSRGLFLFPTDSAYKEEVRLHPHTYAASHPDEHRAEAFARAVESGRKHFSDSTAADKSLSGTLQMIHWLLTRQPFAK